MTVNAVIASRHKFTASDGLDLSYCVWEQEDVREYESIVLVLHGIGFHSEPYVVLPQNVHAPNTLFAGLDFRGHGMSGGEWGKLPRLGVMLGDICDWVEHMRVSYPKACVFLLAESMAGPYATLFASQNHELLDGLILVAPAILPSRRQVLHSRTINDLATMLFRRSKGISLGGERVNVDADADPISVRLDDDLVIQDVEPKYIWRIGCAMIRLMFKMSVVVDGPVLILHGGNDNITSPNGSRWLFRRLKSPDKTFVIMRNAHHTILWDSTNPQTFRLLEDWLLPRI